jgi:hypothetical protein
LVIGSGHRRLLEDLLPIEPRQRGERLRTLAHIGLAHELGASLNGTALQFVAQPPGNVGASPPAIAAVPRPAAPVMALTPIDPPMKADELTPEEREALEDRFLDNCMKFQGVGE